MSLSTEPKFDMLYKIEDVPPWYLCILLGFQVGIFPGPAPCASPTPTTLHPPQDPSPLPGQRGHPGYAFLQSKGVVGYNQKKN